MWFLIRTAFWFSLVLVLLPIFSSQSTSRIENAPKVQMSDAFSAATGAFQYVSAMCSEKPEVCAKGGETLTALGYRAREGARVAYELLDARFGDGKQAGASIDGSPAAGKGLETAMQSVRIDPATVRKIEAAAMMQAMPEKIQGGSDTADAVVTGTVSNGGSRRAFIPVPTPKPAS